MLNALVRFARGLALLALGLLAVAALALGLLTWRLSQGPLDVTRLLAREHALVEAAGITARAGHATIMLERLGPAGLQLAVAVQQLAAATPDGSLRASIAAARVSLAGGKLLSGRLAPSAIVVDGGTIALALPPADAPAAHGGPPPAGMPAWIGGLQHLAVHGLQIRLHQAAAAPEMVAGNVDADLERRADGGIAGHAQSDLQAGAARTTLDLLASPQPGGTQATLTATAISPAALAGLLPQLQPLAAIELPIAVRMQAALGAGFQLGEARLALLAGAGTVHAGRGKVALASLAATVSGQGRAWRLDSLRAALAPAGTHGPPPVITGHGRIAPAGSRLQADFAVAIDTLSLPDLPLYWPEGTGGGARAWLTQNLTAGRATDAQLAGSFEAAPDLTDIRLTALAGGLLADDVTVLWLPPIPGLAHAHGRVTVEGPDALTATMDRGGQDGLVLAPGSTIRVTGLSAAHQFGDIAVGLSGPLPAALALLDHPRLHLLGRSGLEIAGAAGQMQARLTLRVPLENRVTIDQIPIAASASLSGVHLGHVAAGRDLDDGEIALTVTNDGMKASGTGAVAGIPARLGLAMDFRDGPPSQVLQHVTAAGAATVPQLGAAGLPAGAVHLLTGGAADLRVDYTARRDGTAALQLDADLTRAALATPLSWTKPAGKPGAIGGRMTLDHGVVTGVEDLHAEAPGLAIVSRTQVSGQARTLILDRLAIGDTLAHGQIGFPATPGAALRVDLAGPMLDLAAQLEPAKPAKPATPAVPPAPEPPETRGQAWTAKLAFGQLRLSRGRTVPAFNLDAASDGLHILHAHARAGAPGELAVDITPIAGGRTLAVEAADAGAALRALGVADNLAGGRLALTGRYDDTQPGAPLTGTATLSAFTLRNAPGIGRLLQALTVYGLTDVARGPGLYFSKMVAPFGWRDRVLHLANARAFSPSLGITAQGNLDLGRHVADLTGTVVPAYFFNQLLGDLPLIGRVFSPEKGGGVFAARYSVRGPLADPKVGVNPLSALTPGFLREGFGLFTPRKAAAP